MIADFIRELETEILRTSRAEMERQAEDIRIHIKQRTRRGIGVNERRFVSYARSTQKRKGVGPQPVTLTQSAANSMLDTMRTRQVRGTSAPRGNLAFEVYFATRQKERLAIFQHRGTTRRGRRHIPARRFFGTTTRFSNRLANRMRTRINSNIDTRTDRRRRITTTVTI